MNQRLEYLAPDTELVCAVCLDPWTDPVELLPCTHIFCKACLWRQKKCPVCRADVETRQQPHRIMINMVGALKVRCTECRWEGARVDAAAHPCTNPPLPTRCSVERCAHGLRGVNAMMDDIRANRAKELFEVESKWNALLVSGMHRQHALLSGASAPTAEELALGATIAPRRSGGDIAECPAGVTLPIAGYWHSILRRFMDDHYSGYECDVSHHDEHALCGLTGIVYQHLPSPNPSVVFEFHFRPDNQPLPFTNEVLTATMHFSSACVYHEWHALDRPMEEDDCSIVASAVHWRNPENNPTRGTRRNGRSYPRQSFFNIWSESTELSERVSALRAVREAALHNSVKLYEEYDVCSDGTYDEGEETASASASSETSSDSWEDASSEGEETVSVEPHRHHGHGRLRGGHGGGNHARQLAARRHGAANRASGGSGGQMGECQHQ